MKKNRCVTKRKFKTTFALEKAAADIYLKKGIALNYYECPHCLDFHLTKNPNAKKIHIRSDLFLVGWGRKSTERILVENRRKMMRHFQEWRRQYKKKKIKQETLPIERQREALKQLSPQLNRQTPLEE